MSPRPRRDVRLALVCLACTGCAASPSSPPPGFHTGPVFTEFGPVVAVTPDLELPADVEFHVAFDVEAGAAPGEVNRGFVSAARFINMHVEAGVPLERLHLALIVHGTATLDLLAQPAYAARREGRANANAAVLAALAHEGVEIIVCGQSAAAHGVDAEQLLPEVKVALSAMNAHALLQQRGYTLNPF